MAVAHKENSPLTHDNLMSANEQHKEKISSTTDDDSNTNSKPKKEIKFTPDYEAGKPTFLHVFGELANDNNGLVFHDKLQEGLISTGEFDAGEAVLMIEHMEKIGEMEHTEQYHMYRITSQG